jgi:hypothetical protein
MSIGNLKDSGNQGNNLPWQWKVLQGLQAIYDEVSQPLTCVDQVSVCGTTFTNGSLNTHVTNGSGVNAVNIQDGGNSITVDGGTGVQRTATFLRPSGSNGTVGPNIYSASFASVGTANAIVGGINLKPGETLNFDAGAINNTLAAITYNTLTNAGAELIIITLT